MADIEFSVPTRRTVAQVKATIDAEIASRLPGGRIKRYWEGDVFRLVGMGADGRIEVGPGEIRTSVELRAPLSFMKGKVEQGLRETVERAAGGPEGPIHSAAPAGGSVEAVSPQTQEARPIHTAAPAGGSGGAVSSQTQEARPIHSAAPAGGSGGAVSPQTQEARPIHSAAPEDALRARIDGVVLAGATAHDEFLTNFGHIHQWRPALVVKPTSREDVLQALAYARQHDLSVSTRGAAHSQSELAINRDGILLDMKSMARILEVDAAARTVTVEPGAIWRDVVGRTWRHGLIPPVLTNNLSVTVGGTLSIAGIGVASFKYGAQTDNVEEIEVATVDGSVHRCSRSENTELFWGVLSGLGQIGIILKAKLRLRRAKPMTRTYYLLYDDVARFLEDARLAMDSGKWDYIESWCAPNPQGLKWVGGVRQPFAKWFFPFHVTVEFDPGSPPDAGRLLDGLKPYATLLEDDLPTHDFANRLVPVFDIWKKLGTWEHLHPWMEVVLPYSTALEYLDTILPDLSPGVQVGGHVLLWPARRSVSEVPLFMTPDEEYLVGFGILPAVPPKFWDVVRPRLEAASELSMAMGGKRYLSGFITFTREQWRQHFGPRWDGLVALKKRHDPEGRLNPGFVPF